MLITPTTTTNIVARFMPLASRSQSLGVASPTAADLASPLGRTVARLVRTIPFPQQYALIGASLSMSYPLHKGVDG